MSYAFLIGAMGTHSSTVVDVTEFIESFKQRWKNAEINDVGSETYLLHWRFEEKKHSVFGGIQRDLQTVSIENGDILTVASFAVWYRNLIPSKYKLFLFSGALGMHIIELTTGISEQEIVSRLEQILASD